MRLAPTFFVFALPLILGCSSGKPAPATPIDRALGEAVEHTFRIPPFFANDRSSIEHDVPVKNETGRPVRFTSVQPSCNCSSSTKLDAMQLAPGAETTLHFIIDLRQRKGPQRFVVYLTEEDGTQWRYALETTIYERARFEEAGSIHFGMVNPSAEQVRTTDFFLCADKAEKLPQEVKFRTDSKCLRVETGPSSDEQLPDGIVQRKISLKIHLHAAKAPGLQNTFVHASAVVGNEKQELLTGVDWNVRTLFEISPTQAYFGLVDPASSKTIERWITLKNPDRHSFTVKKVTTSCSQVHCSVEGPNQGAMVRLRLVLKAKAVTKPLWGEMVIETDNPLQPSIKVPIAALPKPAK